MLKVMFIIPYIVKRFWNEKCVIDFFYIKLKKRVVLKLDGQRDRA